MRFSMTTALLVLEREAEYRAGKPTPAGLFVYQFEMLCRNRLGYDDGLTAHGRRPVLRRRLARPSSNGAAAGRRWSTSPTWSTCARSCTCSEQRRQDPDYEPPVPPLFGEKEGKIARANRGRDPLLPVRGPAAAARLPGGAAAQAARRHSTAKLDADADRSSASWKIA